MGISRQTADRVTGMYCILIAVFIIAVQDTEALQCPPCSCPCNSTNSLDSSPLISTCSNTIKSLKSNPLIFWTIIPGTIHDGEFTKTNTESESTKLIESLATKTSHEN